MNSAISGSGGSGLRLVCGLFGIVGSGMAGLSRSTCS